LVTAPPVGDKWVHEAKLDGYRTQLHVKDGKPILFSRNGLDWTHRFPEIAKASERLDTCTIDGEICAVDAKGLPSFAGLTDALTSKKTQGLVFYAFDMMFGNGGNLMGYPLLTRKNALKTALAKLKGADAKRFAFVDHHNGDGSAMHKAACTMGLEGIVSKRLDAPTSRTTAAASGPKPNAVSARSLSSAAGRRPARLSARLPSVRIRAASSSMSVRLARVITRAISRR
jgi:bifunctional non-homologous end joining protein LigD